MTEHNIKKTRIAITGGAGYIGSQFSSYLKKEGNDHIIIDDLSTGNKENIPIGVNFFEGSIQDTEFLKHTFLSESVWCVIHFAAVKNVEESFSHPEKYFSTNVDGTSSLLRAMKEANVKRLLFSSTAAVYGLQEVNVPANERSSTFPLSNYGISKLKAEELIAAAGKIFDLQYFIFRYFNVAGSISGVINMSDEESVFPIIKASIEEGRTFKIFGNNYDTRDGTCIRDFIHVSDLISAKINALKLFDIGQNNFKEIVNLGSGHGVTVLELVNEFSKIPGITLPFTFEHRRSGDIEYSCADISKSRILLDWKPTIGISQIVKDYL
jgi:UDP-glucose 4-epimerase